MSDDEKLVIASDGSEDFLALDRINLNIDQIGSTIPGSDIMVTLEVTPS